MKMKYNYIGIPTTERFAGEMNLPHLKMTVSDHYDNPFGIRGIMKPLLTGLACLLLACSAIAAETNFDGALASAKENVKKPGGEAYDDAIGKAFAEQHVDTMVRCTESATEADLAAFDLVMRITEDGKVEQALVRPETKVAVCLLGSVGDDVYPKPPEPRYWVHVHMTIME